MKLGTTILIVENDNLLAETIRQSLLKDGFDVCGIAGSLKSAVDLMRKHPVDLALIDIKLDGPEDGIATAKELLKIKWIPIIYITGDSLLTALERSKDTFPAAFLEKPLRTRELFAQIDLALHNFHSGNLPSSVRQPSDHIFVLSQKGYIRIKQNEILYILADRIYAKIYLTTEASSRIYPERQYDHVHASMNLGRIFRQLSPNFYQLSRSLVVNLDYVDRIDSHQLLIANREITIPDGSRAALMNRLGVVKGR